MVFKTGNPFFGSGNGVVGTGKVVFEKQKWGLQRVGSTRNKVLKWSVLMDVKDPCATTRKLSFCDWNGGEPLVSKIF